MKSLLLPLLGFIFLSTSMGATAQFVYTLSSGAITITGYTGPGGAVTIPATISGLPVIAIGNGALQNNSSVTSVIISSGVRSIGNDAFWLCDSLTSITIPGSVTNMGANAFFASGLVSANVAGTIGDGAFANCTSLTCVSMSSSVTGIGISAFYNCTSLTNVTIPAEVTSIGTSAFYNCTSLMTITVDASNAVYSSFDGVLFNKGRTALIQFPGAKGGNYAIPEGVSEIEDGAFFHSQNLRSIIIPSSVSGIGRESLLNCVRLATITVDGQNAFYSSLDGVLFNKSLTTLIQYPGGKAGNYAIPESVTYIGDGAFFNSTDLVGVFFKGNAPSVGFAVLDDTSATAYYLPGTTGWGATFAGRPTALWNPLMQSSGPGFGVGSAGFGFNIIGTADIPVVVEACTNLGTASWVPLQSLNLTNGAFSFTDPKWTNYPARFYRIRSP
jgi:hypothetical protein